ncbi:MAG: glycosyltransferase family 4 protein [Bacteroidia bacterium]
MHIALIHYRLLRKGGLETRLYNYAAELRRRGHAVTLVCARIDPDAPPLPMGVEVLPLPPGWTPKPLRQTVFARQVRLLLDRQTFDFVLSLGRSASPDAVLAPANHRGYLRAMGRRARSLSDYLQDRLDVLAYRQARVILAASEMMRQELTELYGVPAAKIAVLYPPLDTERFHSGQPRVSLRQRWGMVPDRRAFVFVSTSHHRKGLDRLLAVFEALRGEPVDLYIAGDPVRRALPAQVHALGYVDAELPALYAAADATLLPARYEPFGQVVSESLQCGTPVIVSTQCGAAELVGADTGLVLPGDDLAAWREAVRAFDPAAYSIAPDWGVRQGLDTAAHLDRMLAHARMMG